MFVGLVAQRVMDLDFMGMGLTGSRRCGRRTGRTGGVDEVAELPGGGDALAGVAADAGGDFATPEVEECGGAGVVGEEPEGGVGEGELDCGWVHGI